MMFTYPKLSPAEQASLPKLVAEPIAMPNKFEDSTHQLMYCETVAGNMVLKVCNDTSIAKSTFWIGVNHLFAADFPNSLGKLHFTHNFLIQNGTLKVPDFVVASANRFVLTRFLTGLDLEAGEVDDKWVIALAKHITKLHQCTYMNWGSLYAPQFSANEWAKRLNETLVKLVAKCGLQSSDPLISEILAQAKIIQEAEFVPMMLDLRWDQFRCLNSDTLVLVDLDAFVIAPRALDVMLLEYIFTPQQFALFKQIYMQTNTWPDYAAQKPCYQLLLFLMNVLGETNLLRWMSRI